MTSVTFRRIVAVACVLLLVPAVATSVGALDAAQSQVDEDGETYGIELEIVSEDEGTIMVAMSAQGDSVAGYQANISYDPSVVQFVDVTGEDLASPTVNYDNEEGWINFNSGQAEGVDNPLMATLEFEVVGEVGDETPFEFSTDEWETSINDAGGNGGTPSDYPAHDGTLDVSHTSLSVSEETFDSNGAPAGANGDDDSNGAGDEGTAGTDPGDDDDNGSGMSTLVIGLLAFVGAVVVIGAIAGSYLYGTRQAGGGDAE